MRERQRPRSAILVLTLGLLVGLGAPADGQEPETSSEESPPTVRSSPTGAFVITRSVTVAASPDSVWNVVTGDIGGWWDHHVSEEPHRFYVEPSVGGCFCEIFDESGDGVRHAVVTFVKRGETLRFEGPLGFMGNALHMVTTYTLEARGDSTRLSVEIHGAGEVRDGWPEAISGVWRHFLEDRLEPYVAGRLEG